MITELELEIKYQSEKKLSYNSSSIMHGILMECISVEYGKKLHENGWKPFSQVIYEITEESFSWNICTFTKEAKEEIIDKILNIDEFYMRHRDLKLQVCKKTLHQFSYDSLMEEYYFKEQARNITIEFRTPTAFKSHGNYIFMPNVHLIFQSLINKYDSFSSVASVGSEETLEHIERYVSISRYRLRSVNFSLEGIRIPSFLGSITFSVRGPQQLVNLVKMLLIFGQYAGVGIKTALGMGCIQVKGE